MAQDVEPTGQGAAHHISIGPLLSGGDQRHAEQHLQAVLDRLVRHVGMLLDVPSCSVALLDPASGDMVTLSSLQSGADSPRQTRFKSNEGMAGWVAAHGRPLVIDDISTDVRFKRLGGEQVGSAICVPLLDGDQLIGTLTAMSPRRRAFDRHRQLLVQVFADQAMLAATKARQAELAQAQADEMAAMLEAARALTRSLDPGELLQEIVAGIRRVVLCDDAVIYAYDASAQDLRVVAGMGRRVERLGGAHVALSDPSSLSAWVAKQRRPRMTAPVPITTGQVTEQFLAGDVLALLCVPLVSKERLRGVILLGRPTAFNGAELATMLNLANLVAAALENVELYQTARSEREQQAAIFAAGSDGIAIVDASLRVVEANEAFTRLFGAPGSQLIGGTCCQALATETGECGLCHGQCRVAAALETGEPLPHLDCVVKRPSNDVPARRPAPPNSGPVNRKSQPLALESDLRYVDMSVTPVRGPQGRRALLVGRDVTALRQMDLMKASFLSMVSHELRAPLQSINGYLDVILSGMAGDVTQEQYEFIRRARAGSEHLKALVDDVLLMSRRDAGQFHLNIEPTQIEQVVDEACEEVELMATDAGITLTCEKQPGLPVIPADAPRIQQVLRNILTNAIKFTPQGGRVTLSATYGKNWVRVIVKDTGIGISAEHLPHIFERFYQVQTSGARSKGQGLGLAIARIIVDGHHGTLEVKSEPGAGTAFSLLLPREPQA